jgi:hypothetical protein
MKLHMDANLFGLESMRTHTGAPQPIASLPISLGLWS